jgi:hypothetical protein
MGETRAASVLSPIISIRMHPNIGRDLPLSRQLDHVQGRSLSPLLAGPAFQRGFQFLDRGIAWPPDRIERDARPRLAAMAFDLKIVARRIEKEDA